MNNLEKFLWKLEKEKSAVALELPFFHSCTFKQASVYAKDRKINSTHCDFFDKKMIYLFLGRSHYRPLQSDQTLESTPIGFVFKPKSDIEVTGLFPFDTGAVALELYKPALMPEHKTIVKEDMYIGKDLRLAFQWILLMFKDLDNYLKPKAVIDPKEMRHLAIRGNAPAIERIHDVYTCKWVNGDCRRITVEVHLETDIKFSRNNLAAMTMPLEFEANEEFQDIRIETGAEFLFFDEPSSMLSETYWDSITDLSIKLSQKNGN